MRRIRIAVQGCCHGQLDNVYKKVKEMDARKKIDLLIILGDFQSIRNKEDFKSISIPPKYQRLGDFHKYYFGNSLAPVPTIFIGGNHESMRHLMQLPYGGFVANNIYYLGYSNTIWFKGIRIGSLSGIWKGWDFEKTRLSWHRMESQNWKANIKSLYHVRKSDVIPLFMIRKPMHVMLSHDWPNEAVYYGDVNELLRKKPFFKKDMDTHELGSPLSWELLERIKPNWWLSAHLHVKYRATIDHSTINKKSSTPVQKKNNAEIDLDLFSDEDEQECTNESASNRDNADISKTNFLSLDKCLPMRQWLEIIEVEPDISHPSYGTEDMYWDEEFIENLIYYEKNNSKLNEIEFDNIDWDETIRDKRSISLPHNEKDVYRIPKYVSGVQRRENEQTSSFRERFFS